MRVMTSVRDLRTWVRDRVAADTTDETVGDIVGAILERRTPRWGADWSDYLELLPENLHDLI